MLLNKEPTEKRKIQKKIMIIINTSTSRARFMDFLTKRVFKHQIQNRTTTCFQRHKFRGSYPKGPHQRKCWPPCFETNYTRVQVKLRCLPLDLCTPNQTVKIRDGTSRVVENTFFVVVNVDTNIYSAGKTYTNTVDE